MFGDYEILLALYDGARQAEADGDAPLTNALDAMVGSLVESTRHREDIRQWRADDLAAIYQRYPQRSS